MSETKKSAPRNISEGEITFIQQTFDERLLKSMRALLLGFPVTPSDKSAVRSIFSSDEARRIMRKRFLPDLNPLAELGQEQDVWLGTEEMVYGAPRDTIEQAIRYKQKSIEMTEMGLKLLENPDLPQISLKYDPDLSVGDVLRVDLLARNQYIKHVTTQILFLHMIYMQRPEEKEKTKRNAKEAINKDSDK